MTYTRLAAEPSVSALLAAGDVAYDWDLVRQRVSLTGPLHHLFEVIGSNMVLEAGSLLCHLPEEDRASHLADLDLLQQVDREFRFLRNDGGVLWLHDRGRVERAADGQPIRLRGIWRLVTERKEQQAQLLQQSQFDPLTGRANRRQLRDLLEQQITLHRQRGWHGAYLVVGIDHMALVNDAVGPDAADHLLLGVAQRIDRVLKAGHRLGRVGGDQFGVVLDRVLAADLPQLAEKILEAFRGQPLQTPVAPVQISVSIGAVCFPQPIASAGEVLICAEQALREAQRAGRNNFALYRRSEERRAERRRLLQLGEQVHRALRGNGMFLSYQPIVDVADGNRPLYYEALVRMRDDTGEVVPAGLFVPVIEQLGLSTLLDRRVLEMAIAELAAWPALHLSINVSALTAAQPEWAEIVGNLLAGREQVAQRLIMEITETAALADLAQTQRFVARLRAAGGRIALDDFGAGHTAIRHLRDLQVDILKLDRGLMQDLLHQADQQVVLRTLVTLARGLRLEIVAEGVENAELAAFLLGEGISHQQGWHFGKPSLDRPWATTAAAPHLIAQQAPAITTERSREQGTG